MISGISSPVCITQSPPNSNRLPTITTVRLEIYTTKTQLFQVWYIRSNVYYHNPQMYNFSAVCRTQRNFAMLRSAFFQITARYTLCIRGQSWQGSDSDAGLVRWWKDDCGEIAAAQLMISEGYILRPFSSDHHWTALTQPGWRIWTEL